MGHSDTEILLSMISVSEDTYPSMDTGGCLYFHHVFSSSTLYLDKEHLFVELYIELLDHSSHRISFGILDQLTFCHIKPFQAKYTMFGVLETTPKGEHVL